MTHETHTVRLTHTRTHHTHTHTHTTPHNPPLVDAGQATHGLTQSILMLNDTQNPHGEIDTHTHTHARARTLTHTLTHTTPHNPPHVDAGQATHGLTQSILMLNDTRNSHGELTHTRAHTHHTYSHTHNTTQPTCC